MNFASDNTAGIAPDILQALVAGNDGFAMGYGNDDMTAHGYRAMARTMIAERLGIAPEVIEAQLAHTVADSLGRAYNRTQYLEQRREMMSKWADYIDQLREGAQVIPFKTA